MSGRESGINKNQHRILHTVEVDTGRCSLCEACARRCPTGALFVECSGGSLRLFFRSDRCDGCPGKQNCQALCPEEAIRLVSQEQPADAVTLPDALLLVQSEMLRCQYCGEYFSPVQKIKAVARRNRKHSEPIREYCPLCRRTNMVVHFIDEKRMPTGKAEYRSGKDILRRARERAETEKKK